MVYDGICPWGKNMDFDQPSISNGYHWILVEVLGAHRFTVDFRLP
jgi:hypothetical protein